MEDNISDILYIYAHYYGYLWKCYFRDLFQEVQGFKQRGLLKITQLVSGLHGGLKVLSMGQQHIMARC